MTHTAMMENKRIQYEPNGDILFEASPEQVVKPVVKPSCRIIAIGVSEHGQPFNVISTEGELMEADFMALRSKKIQLLTPMSDEVAEAIESEWIGREESTTGGYPV